MGGKIVKSSKVLTVRVLAAAMLWILFFYTDHSQMQPVNAQAIVVTLD